MEYVHGGDIYTYGDVLDFSVNVNPYGPSEEVLEAAKRSMDEVSLYPDSQCRRLRKRLAEKKSLPEEYFLHRFSIKLFCKSAPAFIIVFPFRINDPFISVSDIYLNLFFRSFPQF